MEPTSAESPVATPVAARARELAPPFGPVAPTDPAAGTAGAAERAPVVPAAGPRPLGRAWRTDSGALVYDPWAWWALLTLSIHAAGRPVTVAELVDVVTREGVEPGGRPSKVISDALRAEVAKGWVRRVGRGLYAPGRLPRSSKSRLRARLERARAAGR